MGNTNTINISPPITVSPPLNNSQNPALNVHQTSNPNIAPNVERKEEKTDDVVHVHEHKSSHTVEGQNNVADRSGGSSSTGGPPGTKWDEIQDDDDMHDVDDEVQQGSSHFHAGKQSGRTSTSLVPVSEKELGKTSASLKSLSLTPHTNGTPLSLAPTTSTNDRVLEVRRLAEAVFDRVFTDVHTVTNTQATVPPVRTAQLNIDDTMSHVGTAGKTVHFETKQITIRVDLRSPSSPFYGFGLAKAPSNNLTSLRRVLFRASTLTSTNFNANKMLDGLQQGKVHVYGLDRTQQEKLKEHIKTATAAAAQNGSGLDGPFPLDSSSVAPSSLPILSSRSSIPSYWTTQFTLYFDTITNTKTAYASLSAMRLSPSVPQPRIITGQVLGFPFTATNDEIETHLKMHAWYAGGAPSFIITRAMQPASRMHGCPQPRDECFYSVLATEYNKALNIPCLKTSRPLIFKQYTRSKTVVCYHCNKVGHTGSTCAVKDVVNAAGMRDACIMCGSFDHVHETCPARDDPNATCIICKKGKHTVRGCPEYRGTYKTIVPRGPARSAWTGKKWTTTQPQTQTQTQETSRTQIRPQTYVQQHTQQQQQNQPSQEQGKLIEMLLTQNTAMQATINTLTEQVALLTQMMSSYMTATHTNTNKAGMIMHDDNTTETDITPAPAPAKKAKTGSTKNKTQHAVNKTQNDITKGTPRVNSFFQPATNKTTQDTDDDDAATPASAFSALTSITTPIAKQGKRPRNEEEEEKKEEDDAPLITKPPTKTAPFTLGAKEKEKEKTKRK